MDRPILIAGPTASGKSALALALARRFRGVVINADSMQVYQALRILTARPTAEEEALVPHRLYGHVAAADAYSVARWLEDVREALTEAREHGWRPIIAGGTGLYFKALTEGLSPVPPIPADVRAYWRAEAQRLDAAALHGELAKRDPLTAARLAPRDVQRVTRALEVFEATGRSLGSWQREKGRPLIAEETAVRLVQVPPRAEVYARADARLERMVAAGAIEEVASLMALGLDERLPIMRALGVRQLAGVLSGACSREEATRQAQTETRRYVKRQFTWLKRHMIAWNDIHTQYNQRCGADSFAFIDD